MVINFLTPRQKELREKELKIVSFYKEAVKQSAGHSYSRVVAAVAGHFEMTVPGIRRILHKYGHTKQSYDTQRNNSQSC